MIDVQPVEAKLETTPRGNAQLVIKCPICGKKHTHGGGAREEVEKYREQMGTTSSSYVLMGTRISHCGVGFDTGQYALYVPKDQILDYLNGRRHGRCV